MADNHDIWHWQEPGTAWKGIGIYHMTLTTAGRRPILGSLEIPEQDPAKAYVAETPLAKDLVQCLLHLHEHFPEIRVLQFCVMPDHLHAIIHVWRPMPRSIRMVARSFWQAAKRLVSSPRPADSSCRSSIASELYSDNPVPASRSFIASGLYPDIPSSAEANSRSSIASELYSDNPFTERPFLRPLSRQGQLQSMIRYVQMNPARLATKRLKPGFFCVQHNVEINGRMYDAVGNIFILSEEHRQPVHVRHDLVNLAKAGNDQPLRDYMNDCVKAARNGTVMVSPYISEYEKDVLNVLLKENRFVILLADNGFGKFFKPSDALFDAVAQGRLLILSPWQHDPDKRHISRPECVALNGFAEEICSI